MVNLDAVDAENQARYTEFVRRVHVHVQKGRSFQFETLSLVHTDRCVLFAEGVLMSVHIRPHTMVYPIARAECGRCGAEMALTREQPGHWDGDAECVTCSNCRTDRCQPLTVSQDFGMLPFELIIFEGVYEETPGLEDKYRHLLETIQKAAARPDSDMVYLNNRTILDLRTEFLAKRVLRAFRHRVRVRREQAKVFRVLYHCAGLGMDASATLAKGIRVPLEC